MNPRGSTTPDGRFVCTGCQRERALVDGLCDDCTIQKHGSLLTALLPNVQAIVQANPVFEARDGRTGVQAQPECPPPWTRQRPRAAGRYWCKIGHGLPEVVIMQDRNGMSDNSNLYVAVLGQMRFAQLDVFIESFARKGLVLWWAPEPLEPPLGWHPELLAKGLPRLGPEFVLFAGAPRTPMQSEIVADFWQCLWLYSGWLRLYRELDRAAEAALAQPCPTCHGACGYRDSTGLADSEDKPWRDCPTCAGCGNRSYETDTNLIFCVVRRKDNAYLRMVNLHYIP